ncbi:hypothetical protein HPB49_006187 [Dermacentor silvarum]|uniref:Uncharacterized protein n=1 Tax=Dermacentor silvarum TaxID=543639 RepID=A0ACB8CVJ8_DERSI|nr:hypothetical protein HPB49_006187 [Dermacentor silvarum]
MKETTETLYEPMSRMRSETVLQELWDHAGTVATQLGLKEPHSGRPTKPPRRFEMSSTSLPPVTLYPKAALRKEYFEAINRTMSVMRRRFDQSGME